MCRNTFDCSPVIFLALTRSVSFSNCLYFEWHLTLEVHQFHYFWGLQLLQQNLETNFSSGQFSWDEVSPNDAAALLKKFIRELPAPLLTAEYLNTFSAVRGQWKQCYGHCFFLICDEHQQLLLYTFKAAQQGSQINYVCNIAMATLALSFICYGWEIHIKMNKLIAFKEASLQCTDLLFSY